MTTKKRQAPKGILGFPVAPMDAEGKLDLHGLGKNIEFLVEEWFVFRFCSMRSRRIACN